MRNLAKVIVVAACLISVSAIAAYIIGQTQPNAARVMSLKLEFKPRLNAIVRSENLLVTNITVINTITNWVIPEWTNILVVESIDISTSTYQQTLYTFPTIETHLNSTEMKFCKDLTLGQLGLTTTSTFEQAVDAMVQTGMAIKGYSVYSGSLL